MSKEVAFLIATGITFGISLLVVALLWRKLQVILLDLSESEKRAPFWLYFWAALVLLVPLVVLMLGHQGISSRGFGFFLVIDLLGLGLAGLVGALLGVGIGMGILVQSRSATIYIRPDQVSDLERLLERVEEIRARNILRRVPEHEQSSA